MESQDLDNDTKQEPLKPDPPTPTGVESPKKKEKSQTKLLLQLANNLAELFHSPGGQGWARIKVGGNPKFHFENWPLRSTQFRNWITQKYYRKWGRTFAEASYQEALKVLEARAAFEGIQRDIFNRVGEYEGKIYLDLANETWQAVEISPDGWKIVEPPIVFQRKNGMQPLPTPVRGGSVTELYPFLNIRGDDLILVIAFLLAELRAGGPFPILNLMGEPGSAKSTAGRVVRIVVDPFKPPLRRPPRESRDLAIAAKNGWLIAFDNVSHVPDWLSDDLCSLATGGGFSTRQLYTDEDETLFDGQRPIMLNGITDVMAVHHDLADRALIVRLDQITKKKRRPERKFWADFRAAHPRILGALLNAVAVALKRIPSIVLTEMPRMADFATWIVAAEPGLGWPEGTFMAAYGRMLGDMAADALEGDLVGAAVRMLMADRTEWSGTASDLMDELERLITNDEIRKRHWPGAPNALSNRLRRVAPALREAGIDVQFGRGKDKKGSKLIRITRAADATGGGDADDDATGAGDADDESPRSSGASSEKVVPFAPDKPDIGDEHLHGDALGKEQEAA